MPIGQCNKPLCRRRGGDYTLWATPEPERESEVVAGESLHLGGGKMIDQCSLHVTDLERSRCFYDAALGRLGIPTGRAARSGVHWVGDGVEAFSINEIRSGRNARQVREAHLAFVARSRPAVDAFHAAALRAGGRNDREPGLRPEYHPNYYAALVLDPDGHRIEAVCHTPD
jgi:Predicted lactoylglutathione lyase